MECMDETGFRLHTSLVKIIGAITLTALASFFDKRNKCEVRRSDETPSISSRDSRSTRDRPRALCL